MNYHQYFVKILPWVHREKLSKYVLYLTQIYLKKKSILTVVSKLAGPSYDHAQHS